MLYNFKNHLTLKNVGIAATTAAAAAAFVYTSDYSSSVRVGLSTGAAGAIAGGVMGLLFGGFVGGFRETSNDIEMYAGAAIGLTLGTLSGAAVSFIAGYTGTNMLSAAVPKEDVLHLGRTIRNMF